MKPFTEEARYEYDLTPDSVVIDAGGYEGQFSAELSKRYDCRIYVFEPVKAFAVKCHAALKPFQRAVVINRGLSDISGPDYIHLQNNSSGVFSPSPDVEAVEMICMKDVIDIYTGASVDLLKLNIEGSEFAVLEDCIANDLIPCFRNIQVQFHPVVEDAEARYQKIRETLLKTHRLTFDAPWCWENYERL